MSTLLNNFDVLKGHPPSYLKNASLLVRKGKIADIYPEDLPPDLDSDRVVEGEGKLLMPGLVDTHTHLGMTLFRGYSDDLPLKEWLEDWIWPAEEHLSREDIYWASLLGISELIRSGVTCFADMYFHMDAVAEATEKAGIRALLSSGIIAPSMKEGGEEELDMALELARDWNGVNNDRIRVALSPHALYTCGREVWDRVIELAGERNLPIHTHLAETEKDFEQSLQEYDLSPLQRLDSMGALEADMIAAHCVHLGEGDFRLLSQSGTAVSHNPTSNMKLSSGIAPVTELHESGVLIGLGTDGPASNNDLDMFEEMRLASFLGKVSTGDPTSLPDEDVFKMATMDGANALGWEHLGVIEVGARADLIAVDRNHPHLVPEYDPVSNIVYAAHTGDVKLVMVDGDLLMEDRNLKFIEENEVLEQVRRRAKKYQKMRGS